jgi:hypothetical protein
MNSRSACKTHGLCKHDFRMGIQRIRFLLHPQGDLWGGRQYRASIRTPANMLAMRIQARRQSAARAFQVVASGQSVDAKRDAANPTGWVCGVLICWD